MSNPENRFRNHPDEGEAYVSSVSDVDIKEASMRMEAGSGNVPSHVPDKYLEEHKGRESLSPTQLANIARAGGAMPKFGTTELPGETPDEPGVDVREQFEKKENQ